MLGRRSLPGDWRRARRGGEPATPRLLPPTVTARGEPRAGPQGSRWLTSEGASKGKALTHSKSGPAFVLASVHTLPPRVTSYGHSRCSHWLHTPISPHSQADSESPEVQPLQLSQAPELSSSGVTFTP